VTTTRESEAGDETLVTTSDGVPAGRQTVPLDQARRRVILEVAVVVVALLCAVAIHKGTMAKPLVEAHQFRQTQTAFTALEFKKNGIDLLHPQLPVFGPPFEAPFEFPLFQAIATIPMNLGMHTDAAMRYTSFAFFLLTALLLYGLVRRVTGPVAAVGALIAFLFSPLGILWSRTSLIEYLATAGAVGFVWAGIVWRDSRRWPMLVLAIAAGLVAMLVKVTTGVFWILPLVLYTGADDLRGVATWLRNRLRPGFIAIIGVPVVGAIWWTRHADAIKAANPATSWLTSANLNAWNFGTLDQRTDPHNWLAIFDRAERLMGGKYIWIGLVVVAVWWARKQGFWLGMVLAAIVPPAVFFNLYWVHDYYLIAISPAVAALLGLAAQWIWEHRPRRFRLDGAAAIFAVGLLLFWLAWALWPTPEYWRTIYSTVTAPSVDAANEMSAIVPRNALVIVQGADWDPTLLYYSRREGMMLPPRTATPAVLRRLPRQGYTYLFSFDPASTDIDLMREWNWIGVRGARTYQLASDPSELSRASVIAQTSSSEAAPAGTTVSLPCDGTIMPVAASAAPTRVTLLGPARTGVRIWTTDGGAPLPWVSTISATQPLELHCSGADSLELVISR
jgi:hypothetical protein